MARDKMGKKSSDGSKSADTAGIGMAGGMIAKPTPQQINAEMQFRAEDDLRTLHRAHQIVTDKPRHAAVKKLHEQQAHALFGKKK